jgi:diguanylate cyclase (GGDEF)-like protein
MTGRQMVSALRAVMTRLMLPFAAAINMNAEQLKRFNQASMPARIERFLVTGIISIALFDVCLFVDKSMLPDVFDLAVVVRLYIVTPVVLGMIALGFTVRSWWLKHVPPWVTELLPTAGTIMASLSLGYLMLKSDSPQVPAFRAGLVLFLIFGNLIQRLRFRYAVAATLANLGTYAVTMHASQGQANLPHQAIEVPMAFLMLLVALYTLATNFNLDMDDRQRFLRNERLAALKDELSQTHEALQRVARQDALTGLSNRHGFDEHITRLMGQGTEAKCVSVILVDVDHFKAFNDCYGHPAGDQCLRMVASALSKPLSQAHGFLARWGGEEFIAILQCSGEHEALLAADAMRQSVLALQMRHKGSTTADSVTVSCGVATAPHRLQQLADIARLVGQADSALYRAKSRGRNQCALFEGELTAQV